MKTSYTTIEFTISELLILLNMDLIITGEDMQRIMSLIRKVARSAYVRLCYDSTNGQITLTLDSNKLDKSIENVEEIAEYIFAQIDSAQRIIEQKNNRTTHCELNRCKQLVKIYGQLGDTISKTKCKDYEQFGNEEDVTFLAVDKIVIHCNPNQHSRIETLRFRSAGQDIKCTVDFDTAAKTAEIIHEYLDRNVNQLDVYVTARKNQVDKYHDVKLVGIEQSE